jgi:DNA-binding beta-propeller fold protein YncE
LKLRSQGQRIAYLAGFTSVGILLASGCGTAVPDSATKGSPSTSSAAAAAVSSGAQLGLIWNPADSTLRSLAGVPGSTQLGPALFPAGAYAAGAYASGTRTALLIDPKGNLQMMTLPSTQPETVAQSVSPASVIVFAPRGAYAAIFAPGSTSVLVVGGLPQAPVTTGIAAVAAVQGAAISDAGTLLLATSAGNGSVTVTAINAGGTRSTLATLAGFGGMSFIAGSEDSLIADSAANTVARYRNGAAVILATHANGLNQPFAIAASQDGHWAVAADKADSGLLRIDLTGLTAPVQSTCACSPNQLSALSGNAVFELAAPAAAPGWMIEADSPTARVLFIPPARSGQ